MGGATTEIGATATDRRRARGGALGSGRRSPAPPGGTSCPARRRERFERGVDPQLPPVAADRAARAARRARRRHGRARRHRLSGAAPGARRRCAWRWTCPTASPASPTRAAPRSAGCTRSAAPSSSTRAPTGAARSVATPPRWRPDLTEPADLVEEVLRLDGYDGDPVGAAAPRPPAAGSPRRSAAAARSAGRWPGPGYVEVLPSPFVGAGGVRRARAARRRPAPPHGALANPLDADRAALRTTLLPGLLDTLGRNRRAGPSTSRCYDVGPGLPAAPRPGRTPEPGVDDRPDRRRARAARRRAAATSRVHVGVVLAGDRDRAAGGAGPAGRLGRRGRGRPARRRAPRGVELRAHRGRHRRPGTPAAAPRCSSGDWIVGHAGELHPGSSRRSGCRRAPARSSWTSTPCRCVDDRAGAAVSPLPAGGRRTSRWSRPTTCPPPSVDRRAARRRRRAAGGGAAVRRLHRRRRSAAGKVAGLRAALPRRRTGR